MLEIWKPIKGFKGYYASNIGNVKSEDRVVTNILGRDRFFKGKILTQRLNVNGYPVVGLSIADGENPRKLYSKPVHRLVALAFLDNPENLPVINHIDGDKTNNKLENLEWTSISYNTKHAYDTGAFVNPKRKKVARLDLNTREVLEIYESATETEKYGFNRGKVCDCCRGDRKHHRGYGWKFL